MRIGDFRCDALPNCAVASLSAASPLNGSIAPLWEHDLSIKNSSISQAAGAEKRYVPQGDNPEAAI